MRVVGIGGTLRANSTTEGALQIALESAATAGASVEMFGAQRLVELPMYAPGAAAASVAAGQLVEALRGADGVVVASPGYHGTVSGLVKNALDYAEELREDARPYLSARSFGCISVAEGWQAAVMTLTALRTVAHSLRAWPTPLGAAVNTAECRFEDGRASNARIQVHVATVGQQVVEFAALRETHRHPGRIEIGA